ncbi:indolepyruvate ferredoxin oxidoreductase [bacterium]|nr:indolepyruvate ferredoxin oxidoreductase [candidate division CSSED10-310 bacterium]
MKRLGDILITPEGGEELLMGNHALVRAMLEAGVRVVTSYPGSPTPEIAAGIMALPVDRNPMYFEFSTNEKVATEVAFGASVNGHLSCVFFKSVGLNVAADSFVQLGHMELIGGLVIVLGDDPGANSSQNEQDNLHLARLSYTPVFEPSGPMEAYLMFKAAAALSRQLRMPMIVRLTTHVCHAKEKLRFEPMPRPAADDTPRFDPANGPYIPITTKVFPMKRKALEKLAGFGRHAESSVFNFTRDNGNRRRGIITMGFPYLSLLDVLERVKEPPDVLKLGIVYPFPREMTAGFLASHEEVKILEELDPLLEQEIKALAFDRGIGVKLTGKIGIDDWMGEYTPDKVQEVLHRAWPDLVEAPLSMHAKRSVPRPPQLCPGCGHRSAFFSIKKALREEDVTVADIGCHTLGYLPPHLMGQVLLSMGHATGTAAGLALFNRTRRVVAFMGDSTFFHAGIPGVVNAIHHRHNVTLVIMENGTTAMTGHQDNPSTQLPIERVLRGLGVENVRKTDAYNQKKLAQLVREAVEEEGFSVVIAAHPCMLKLSREQRKAGRPRPSPVVVTDACDDHHVCISEFACPTYQFSMEGAVVVQDDLCIGDGSCIQTCPVKAVEPGKRA